MSTREQKLRQEEARAAALIELTMSLRCAGCGRCPEEIETFLLPTAVEFADAAGIDLSPTPTDKWDFNQKVAGRWAQATPEERTAAIRRYCLLTEPTLNEKTGAFCCDTCYLIAGMPLVRGETEWSPPMGHEWPVDREQFAQFAESKRMSVPTNKEDNP